MCNMFLKLVQPWHGEMPQRGSLLKWRDMRANVFGMTQGRVRLVHVFDMLFFVVFLRWQNVGAFAALGWCTLQSLPSFLPASQAFFNFAVFNAAKMHRGSIMAQSISIFPAQFCEPTRGKTCTFEKQPTSNIIYIFYSFKFTNDFSVCEGTGSIVRSCATIVLWQCLFCKCMFGDSWRRTISSNCPVLHHSKCLGYKKLNVFDNLTKACLKMVTLSLNCWPAFPVLFLFHVDDSTWIYQVSCDGLNMLELMMYIKMMIIA